MSRNKNDGKGRLGGRAKGTPNKITTDLKEWITEILKSGKELFAEHLNSLEPREYVKVYVGLLNYVVPKQQSVSVDAEAEIKQHEQDKILTKEELKELHRQLEND